MVVTPKGREYMGKAWGGSQTAPDGTKWSFPRLDTTPKAIDVLYDVTTIVL